MLGLDHEVAVAPASRDGCRDSYLYACDSCCLVLYVVALGGAGVGFDAGVGLIGWSG